MFYIEAVLRGGVFERVQYVIWGNIWESICPSKFVVVMGPPEFVGEMPVRTDVGVKPL